MNEKSLTIKILRRKHHEVISYNLMQVMSASAPYESASLNNKISDALTLPIPEGVKEIKIEALTTNIINIWYRTPQI